MFKENILFTFHFQLDLTEFLFIWGRGKVWVTPADVGGLFLAVLRRPLLDLEHLSCPDFFLISFF